MADSLARILLLLVIVALIEVIALAYVLGIMGNY